MTDSCKWGILSTAGIAKKNWQAILNSGNAEVGAVASRSIDSAQSFIDACQADHPFETSPKAYGSYDELLADPDIQAVYIPLPTGMRKEWVIKTAEAGKHVLAEKPAARHADEVQAMLDACNANGVQYMDGVMYMHSDRLPLLRQALDNPDNLGTIRRISSVFCFAAVPGFLENNIRVNSDLEPMGCLGDLGWYTARMILWIKHYEMPKTVIGKILSAQSRADSPEPVPTQFSAELFYEDGTSASFYNSFICAFQQWLNVAGSDGYLHVPDFVLPNDSGQIGFDLKTADDLSTTTVDEVGAFHESAQETKMIRAFNQIVLSGQLDPGWGEITLKTQRVLDALFASAKQDGAPVSL